MTIAVVTGASSGIGYELAKKLAENGVIVYAVARREDKLQELYDLHPEYIRPICADLSTEQGVNKVIEVIRGHAVDYLVNNAAILPLKPLSQMTFQDHLEIYAVNAAAPAFLIGHLSFSQEARIINMTSVAAESPLAGLVGYSMTKGALNSLSKGAEAELCSNSQRLVLSFIPGEVDTNMQVMLQNYPPLASIFQAAKENGDLLKAEVSAQCVSWLLLSSTPQQFLSGKEIYKEEYWPFWLEQGQIVPIPKARMATLTSSMPESAFWEAKKKGNFPAAHILMPVYNSAPFIVNTLNSVFSQNYENIQLILINDASTDNTMAIVGEYLREHSDSAKKVTILHNEKNEGTAFTRMMLWKQSKQLNPDAYIFWLDSDDTYSNNNVVQAVIHQMRVTQADICVFNFSVQYEDPSQMANAAGLIRDKENSRQVLQTIFNSDKGVASPLEIQAMRLTALGWIKCYAPSVHMPQSANYPFEDFVSMAVLLQAQKITAIDPDKELIHYLRRSTSICGQRKPENFTLHIPAQLKRFFEAVLESTQADENQIQKLQMAEEFVLYKSAQYTDTLSTLVNSGTRADMNEAVLRSYTCEIETIKHFITEEITSAQEKVALSSLRK